MRYCELTEASRWSPRADAQASAPSATIISIVDRMAGRDDPPPRNEPAATFGPDIEHVVVLDGTIEDGAGRSEDGAASLIVHPRPLDLAGLAAAEAVQRSTGRFIVFLRPHWHADAAAILDLAAACDREDAGWAMPPVAGPDGRLLLRPPARPEVLDAFDPFDRLALSIRRDLFAEIGLPDPHVALGSHWLWDLANRARRAARELRFDRPIARSAHAEPAGPQIGAVPGAVVEFARSDRRDVLRPDRIGERDLIEAPTGLWSITNAHTQSLAARRGWAARANTADHGPAADRPIVVYGDHSASVSLYFDGLPAPWSTRLRFVPMSQPEVDALRLAEAAVVIFVRDVRQPDESGIVGLLGALGIPGYAFFDDNFAALAGEYAAFAFYTRENLAKALAKYAGVIATSPDLADWFRDECGASRTTVWPCVIDGTLVPSAPSADREALRIGMTGGPFRQNALVSDVAPALDVLAGSRPVALWTRDDVAVPTAARVHAVPYDVSFASFVRRWRAFDIHALVHPRGDTANLRYKTPNALLVALYLGAVPVVEAEPAYDGLTEEDGVLVVRDGRTGWQRALAELGDASRRGQLYARLRDTCRRRFADGAAVTALARIAEAAPRVDVAEFHRRLPILGEWLAARGRAAWDRDDRPIGPAVALEPLSLRLLLRHPRKGLIRLLSR